jgi:hypothetical protein
MLLMISANEKVKEKSITCHTVSVKIVDFSWRMYIITSWKEGLYHWLVPPCGVCKMGPTVLPSLLNIFLFEIITLDNKNCGLALYCSLLWLKLCVDCSLESVAKTRQTREGWPLLMR